MPSISNASQIYNPRQIADQAVDSTDIKDGTIVNADVAANAAIDQSKLANAAKSGANSDITSLSALSTALSVPQGGTGVATRTAHLINVGNGASNPVEIAIGNSGDVLKSGGAGADPAFGPLTGVPVLAGTSTLGGAANNITVSGLAAYKHLRVILRLTGKSGSDSDAIQFNTDTAGNYSYNRGLNFVTGAQNTKTYIEISSTSQNSIFAVIDIINETSLKKFVSGHGLSIPTTEALSDNPVLLNMNGNWANTAAQISAIKLFTVGGATYAAGSSMDVYGWA